MQNTLLHITGVHTACSRWWWYAARYQQPRKRDHCSAQPAKDSNRMLSGTSHDANKIYTKEFLYLGLCWIWILSRIGVVRVWVVVHGHVQCVCWALSGTWGCIYGGANCSVNNDTATIYGHSMLIWDTKVLQYLFGRNLCPAALYIWYICLCNNNTMCWKDVKSYAAACYQCKKVKKKKPRFIVIDCPVRCFMRSVCSVLQHADLLRSRPHNFVTYSYAVYV